MDIVFNDIFLSAKEVMNILRVNKSTLNRLIRDGILPTPNLRMNNKRVWKHQIIADFASKKANNVLTDIESTFDCRSKHKYYRKHRTLNY